MKVLFCKISAMKYYKGVVEGKDEAYNGGSFVEEYGEGHEQYNFDTVEIENDEYCVGFVETKTTRKTKRNELHIENISDCEDMKKAPEVDDVLVIWCATTDLNETSVVGWYNNAKVYRNYQYMEFDSGYIQEYNIIAKKKDCVLIPYTDRHLFCWSAPVAKKKGFGFGQSMVWYGQEASAETYIKQIVDRITTYNGKNWIDKSVENP